MCEIGGGKGTEMMEKAALWVQFGALDTAKERVREGDPGQFEESGLDRPLSGCCL